MVSEHTLAIWGTAARDDNWHQIFVGSDIREMIGEIERLRAALKDITEIENEQYGGDWDEIEKARNIAFAALAGDEQVTRSEPCDHLWCSWPRCGCLKANGQSPEDVK